MPPRPSEARRQLFAAIDNANSFTAGTIGNTNFVKAGTDLQFGTPATPVQRQFLSGSRGARQNAPGLQRATLSFTHEMAGFGGTVAVPAIARLLRACGFGQTVESGTASVGAVRIHPANQVGSTGLGTIVVTGTYSGIKSAKVEVTVLGIDEGGDGLLFGVLVRNTDGSGNNHLEFTQAAVGSSAVDVGAALTGLSIRFGSSSTTFAAYYAIGSRYTFQVITADAAAVTLTPVDEEDELGDSPSATKVPFLQFGLIELNRQKAMYGARGNAVLNFTVGQVPNARFDFMGISTGALADDTLETLAPSEVIAPTVRGCTATFGAVDLHFNTIQIALGNQVQMPTDGTEAGGYAPATIASRRIVATIDPLAIPRSELDVIQAARNATTGSLVIEIGSVAGNRITLTATGQVENADSGARESKITDPLSLVLYVPEDNEFEYEMELRFD
jgi:hypothetical protein